MKTLVTGGAGFIGSNVVRRVREEGHDVRVLDNLSSGYRSNLHAFPEVEFIEGDIRDKVVLDRSAKDIDVIFHLAASVGNTRSIENPVDDANINVIGTIQVLEAARAAGVRKIIYSSSAGIFGELKTLPIREDHPVDPDSPYGASKLAAEKLCLAYSKLYDIEAICLRYFNVYGPNQRYDVYGNVIPKFAFLMLRQEELTIYGDGEQTRDFVNVRDVAQANYQAATTQNVSGAFNIASGTAISINRLVDLMRNASDLRPKVKYGPVRKGDVRDSLADISMARKTIGYQPRVGLEEGLTEYFLWANQEAH